jgi:hypothetical protein
MSLHDVMRHLVLHGPARNDAERDQLLGAVNDDDPGYAEPEHVMTAEEKAAEYDRLQAAGPPGRLAPAGQRPADPAAPSVLVSPLAPKAGGLPA